MAELSEEARQGFIAFGEGVMKGSLFYIACMTIVLYDHLTTLDLEIELIWKKKWSLIQVLYLINRYLPDISFLYGSLFGYLKRHTQNCGSCSLVASFDLIHSTFLEFWTLFLCPSLSRVQTWLSIIALQAMQGIMVHRTICMYRQRTVVVYVVTMFFIANLIAGTTLAAFSMVVVNVPTIITRSLHSCTPTNLKDWSVAAWFQMFAFEAVIFVLAVAEGIRYMRDNKAVRRNMDISIRGRWSKEGSLIHVLLRDSLVFPLITLSITFFDILAWYVLPGPAMHYAINMTVTASPVLGCRLVLHLRDAYYQPFAGEMNQATMPSGFRMFNTEMPEFALETVSSTNSDVTGTRPQIDH
ncbi:hypothetical protein DFP72DRAFT_1081795 [Ephemerocybe angulata]|uniref:DUF6533 domain-containing protein n=1 Tax=Ephemerocybe angulata TaxID=980116 RepID=A0A8H6H9V0_9AGAR|nr:hypothetical protein DFP72DRAFT_1081795 [Tulosesus angulatus]